jgi:tRNA pseudouridine55 synthase
VPPAPVGFLNIDKPTGMTSFDVVRAVRRASGVRRVGHAGTLDPLATGVLPVALGSATRLVDALVDARKRYTAELRFGVETDTDDAEGTVTATRDTAALGAEAIAAALAGFVGEQLQLPPAYSAIKRSGQPAYRAARRGEAPALAPRRVVAHALRLTACAPPSATIEIECGKGYYVRALARDLGRTLGVGAHVTALRRTAVGPFEAARAVPLDRALARLDAGAYETLVHAPDAVLTTWPAILLSSEALHHARQGRSFELEPRPGAAIAGGVRARAYAPDGRFAALVRSAEPPRWSPYRVFGE